MTTITKKTTLLAKPVIVQSSDGLLKITDCTFTATDGVTLTGEGFFHEVPGYSHMEFVRDGQTSDVLSISPTADGKKATFGPSEILRFAPDFVRTAGVGTVRIVYMKDESTFENLDIPNVAFPAIGE